MKESRTLEFKQDVTNSFLKTVSAFANFGTGTILFGVDDSGKTVGVSDPDKVRLDIENRVNDSIRPKPEYSISVNRKTNVISMDVQEGKYKPYLYKGKAYRRSDTATLEVDQVELRRLTLEGENLYYEGLPCGTDKLTFNYFESKLDEKLEIKILTEDILRTFGFINDDKSYNNAAAIFADSNQFCGMDIARFGDSISEIQDREMISGASILKQYDGAVILFKRYYQYETIQGIERKTVDRIPEEAFREAIANALVHRTWDINSHVRVAMFPDRIEISSPGGLPKGITEEEYLKGSISNLRNPIIGNVFFRLHYIEMFGTGIRRIKDVYSNAPIKPDFVITDNSISVILPCTDRKMEVSADGGKVLEVLNTGTVLSSREIADGLGWSKDKAIRVLNTLLSAGYIQRIGNGPGTKYVKR